MSDLDTALKRLSGINVASPWRGLYPLPDGTISALDRSTAAFMYGGIGLTAPTVEEELGIGLAPVRRQPMVDFVYSGGWVGGMPIRSVKRFETRHAIRQDDSELKEMMELYNQWKRAA